MAASLLSRLPRGAVRPADLMLIVAVVAIVALLILPLPTIMIDMLVATNIAIGLLLLLSTLHITKPLDFSTFPTVLLLSTLFRLSLSVATTRMILLDGQGGFGDQRGGRRRLGSARGRQRRCVGRVGRDRAIRRRGRRHGRARALLLAEAGAAVACARGRGRGTRLAPSPASPPAGLR